MFVFISHGTDGGMVGDGKEKEKGKGFEKGEQQQNNSKRLC